MTSKKHLLPDHLRALDQLGALLSTHKRPTSILFTPEATRSRSITSSIALLTTVRRDEPTGPVRDGIDATLRVLRNEGYVPLPEPADELEWWTTMVDNSTDRPGFMHGWEFHDPYAKLAWMTRCPVELEAATIWVERMWRSKRTMTECLTNFHVKLRALPELHADYHRACRSPRRGSERTIGDYLAAYLFTRPRHIKGRRRGADLGTRATGTRSHLTAAGRSTPMWADKKTVERMTVAAEEHLSKVPNPDDYQDELFRKAMAIPTGDES